MMRNLCRLLGHRRDGKRIRPYFETFRTKCVRCNISMMRSVSGSWQPFAAGEDAPPPTYKFVKPPETNRSLERSSSIADVMDSVTSRQQFVPGKSGPQPEEIVRTSPYHGAEFYLARADDCRRRAELAADHSIKLIHLDMATRYELLAREEGS